MGRRLIKFILDQPRGKASVSKPGSPRDPDNITGGGSRYEALLEVLEQQQRQAKEDRARAERSRRSPERRIPIWLVVGLGLVAAWLWLIPPPFLRVEEPPPRSGAQEEAALRFAVYVQAQRIEEFRNRSGRLPESLEEVGPPMPGMHYVRLSDGLYQLTGTSDRSRLTYRSDLSLSDFARSGADDPDAMRRP